MTNQVSKQMIVVSQSAIKPGQMTQPVALFNADGSPVVINETSMVPAATQATFAGADITALKVELNAFLAKLKTAGIVLP